VVADGVAIDGLIAGGVVTIPVPGRRAGDHG
jgi:hypothetical protein